MQGSSLVAPNLSATVNVRIQTLVREFDKVWQLQTCPWGDSEKTNYNQLQSADALANVMHIQSSESSSGMLTRTRDVKRQQSSTQYIR